MRNNSQESLDFRQEFLPICCPAKQEYGFLPADTGGGKSKFSGGVFAEKSSDFVQDRQLFEKNRVDPIFTFSKNLQK